MAEAVTKQPLQSGAGDMEPRRHFRALDGLRACAIIAVMVHHYAGVLFPGGTPLTDLLHLIVDLLGTGVDLFFALSGFLITGILYDSLGRSDYFGRFYWRRSLRIFPAYFVFLLPFLFLPGLFTNLSRWQFMLYVRNWCGPDPPSDGLLGHLWSLAVEEQFYIFWAPVVFLVARKHLAWVVVGLSIAALFFRVWMVQIGFPRYDLIRFTPARMDGLLLGGLVAIAWRRWPWGVAKRVAQWCAVISVAALATLLAYSHGSLETFAVEVWLSTLTAVLFASTVALVLQVNGRFLCAPFLGHIAKYSYAMYLWHLLPHAFGLNALAYANQSGQVVSATVRIAYVPCLSLLTYALARLSWHFVERPFLRLKDRYYTGDK